jgi:hypothetical protein
MFTKLICMSLLSHLCCNLEKNLRYCNPPLMPLVLIPADTIRKSACWQELSSIFTCQVFNLGGGGTWWQGALAFGRLI